MHCRAVTWDDVSMFYWVVKAILGPLLRSCSGRGRRGPRTCRARDRRSWPATTCRSPTTSSRPLPLPRKVTFLAKAEYFTGRGLKGLVSKAFFRGVGQIPVDRSGGEASERALATGLRVLARGQAARHLPGGHPDPDGRLYRGKTGDAEVVCRGAPGEVDATAADRRSRSGCAGMVGWLGVGGGGGGGGVGVGGLVAGGVGGEDAVAVAGAGGEGGVVVGGAGAVGGGDLVEGGAAGALAAFDAVAGDADVVGGGGPGEVDLDGAGGGGGQVAGCGRGLAVWRGVVAVAVFE